MNQKIYKPNEISIIFDRERPKYISLISKEGKQVFPKNQNPKVINDRFEEIKKSLENLTPGIYYFTCQNAIKGNPEIFKFPILVGTEEIKNTVEMPIKEFQSIWSPDEALKILNENNKLSLEVENLKRQIDEMQQLIDELEDEIEQKSQLSETNEQTNIIKEVLSVATPLIDKLLSQRDRALDIKHMAVKNPETGAGGSHRKPPATASPEIKEIIIERVNELMINNNNIGLIEFMSNVKDKYPGSYDEILNTVYNENYNKKSE